MKNVRFNFVNGSWVNDDVDLIPTIKVRTGRKSDEQRGVVATGTSIALCWLKWGLMMSFGSVKLIDKK